jgi:hypothetical protein
VRCLPGVPGEPARWAAASTTTRRRRWAAATAVLSGAGINEILILNYLIMRSSFGLFLPREHAV